MDWSHPWHKSLALGWVSQWALMQWELQNVAFWQEFVVQLLLPSEWLKLFTLSVGFWASSPFGAYRLGHLSTGGQVTLTGLYRSTSERLPVLCTQYIPDSAMQVYVVTRVADSPACTLCRSYLNTHFMLVTLNKFPVTWAYMCDFGDFCATLGARRCNQIVS